MRLLLLTLLALVMQIGLSTAAGKSPKALVQLDHSQDRFYKKFGGRVFIVECGKQEIFVWKMPDGKPGWFNCFNHSSSKNIERVFRKKRRWQRTR